MVDTVDTLLFNYLNRILGYRFPAEIAVISAVEYMCVIQLTSGVSTVSTWIRSAAYTPD